MKDVGHILEDLNRFGEEDLNAVLHTYSERDCKFYKKVMADAVAVIESL